MPPNSCRDLQTSANQKVYPKCPDSLKLPESKRPITAVPTTVCVDTLTHSLSRTATFDGMLSYMRWRKAMDAPAPVPNGAGRLKTGYMRRCITTVVSDYLSYT